MKKIRFGGKQLSSTALLLLLVTSLLVTACGTIAPIATAQSVGAATSNPSDSSAINSAPINTTASGSNAAPQANAANPNPKCDALFLANFDIGNALARMVTLTANTDYSAYTSPDSPFYMDFKKLRSELDTLATLPDPSGAEAAIAGKPSEAIVYYHQLMDLAEADIKDNGKPFVDTGPSGVKLIGFDTAWETKAAVFSMAMSNVCKDYTAPSDIFGTPVPASGAAQPTQDDSAMATVIAAGASIQATIDAAETAMPEPTETPAP